MKLSYAAFELAVDRLLSAQSLRNTRSVYDLPQRDLLMAYHEGLSPETFVHSYAQTPSDKAEAKSQTSDAQEQSTLF
jgi:hypothetical protein